MLGRPLALAPEPGGPQVIGEVSGAAEAFGVRAGMRLGEALARCPALALVPPTRSARRRSPSRRCAGSRGSAPRSSPGAAGRGVLRDRAAARPLRDAGAGARQGAAGARPAGRGWRGPDAALRLRRGAADARPAPPRSSTSAPPGAAGSPSLPVGDRCARRPRRDEWERADLARRRSSGSACARWASSRRCPRTRSPTASASAGCGRCGWRAAATSRCARAARTRSSRSELELPEAVSGQQLERALELLIDRLLAHPARAGGRCAGCGSRRGSPRAAAGGAR